MEKYITIEEIIFNAETLEFTATFFAPTGNQLKNVPLTTEQAKWFINNHTKLMAPAAGTNGKIEGNKIYYTF